MTNEIQKLIDLHYIAYQGSMASADAEYTENARNRMLRLELELMNTNDETALDYITGDFMDWYSFTSMSK